MSRDSSRKPSGSSSQSSAHSPTSPGNQPHSGRRTAPTTTGNMLSVGVGAGSGLMGYNSGWQVWGSASPSSQRNPSISSAASTGDIPSSQNDSGYRGTIREGWTSSRPASGTWDEDVTQSPLKEFSQSHEAQAPLTLHPSRQRQASATPFMGSRGENRSAKLSSQPYDHSLNAESASSRFNTTPSSATFVSTPYSASHPTTQSSVLTGASGYDAIDDLSLTFRGMATEDDYSGHTKSIPPVPMPSNMMQRPQPPASVPRPPYGNYPGFSEYSYGFDAPRAPVDPSLYGSPALGNAPYPGVAPQGLHPPTANDLRQPNMFYDFPSHPPASQFYYPAQQGIMFPPPTTTSMMTPQLPPALLDKKRELSYTLNVQQQLIAHALMFPRTTPSPHLPIYPNMEYPQAPVMIPGGSLYGTGLTAQMFHQGIQQGARRTLQSPLLHEFHANKARNWELRDIMNHIVEFSGDQHGSRLIQHKLESASSEEKQKVFEEIVPRNVLQLIQDVFGNYVIQKLFEHGTQIQKSRLAAEMEGHILALSKQMYGCRVVQKAIEYILPEQQASIVRELEPHIMECIHDANGNHVIQKIIERVSPDRLGFVSSFRGNAQALATHTFGCRVLQRALEYLPEFITAPLVEELRASTLLLMQNQFGNYVMQFVIEHGRPVDSTAVIAKLRGQLLVMARHKFASNVCEKALKCADPKTRRQLIDEILSPKPEGAIVLSMMKDQYANYVLQRAVGVADVDQRENLINQIRPQLAILRRISNGYAKHLVSIEKLLQEFSPPHSAVTIP